MAEPKKRIVVDGIEFSQVFLFPCIFRAVPAALQPGRLLIAAFMVLLLVSIGRIWDGFAPAGIHPAGLTAGVWTERDREDAQFILRDALQRFAPERAAAAVAPLTARGVQRDVRSAYRLQRDRTLPSEDLDRMDAEYLRVIAGIETVRPRGAFEAASTHSVQGFYRAIGGLMQFELAGLIEAVTDIVIVLPIVLWQYAPVFTIVYGIVFVLIMAVGGGTLSRMAATDVATQERLRVREALQFAVVRWPRLVVAPLLPFVIAAILAVFILLLGVLMAVPVLDVIGGALYGIALVLGFIIAFLLVAYIGAFGLIVPAIAVEDCDAADAQQRAYAYVLSRPLHLLGYAFIAIVGLVLGYLIIAMFAVATLNMTAATFGMLTNNPALDAAGGYGILDLTLTRPETVQPAWHHAAAAAMIQLWQAVIITIVWAFVVSYLFAAATTVYLLLRRACDGQSIEEIRQPNSV